MIDTKREIKFRLWTKENGMITWEELLKHANNFNTFDLIGHFNNPEAGTLLQYTGLKDKNGKEIYEGDIVYRYGDGKYKIEWNNDYACFCLSGRGYIGLGEIEGYKVIGNIHENPELLE